MVIFHSIWHNIIDNARVVFNREGKSRNVGIQIVYADRQNQSATKVKEQNKYPFFYVCIVFETGLLVYFEKRSLKV